MRFEYRQATAADNAAILAFMSRHTMAAAFDIRFDRTPDFFALSRAHSPANETWLMLQDERIVALGSLVVRPGYVHGSVEPIVYLSDLRVNPGRQVAGQWRSQFGELTRRLAAETGARYAYCAVIRDNRLARNSIVSHRSFRFRHLRGYSTISLLARKRRRRRHEYTINRASAADLDALSELLDSVSKTRFLGAVFDRPEVERRLATWPGLEPERFVVARDDAGNLLGCLAPWDYSALKRIVIESMPPSAEWVRRLFNLLAPIHKRATIDVPPGATVPDIAISHVAIPGHDPELFAALLDVAVRDAIRKRRTATVSLCLYDDDPLWPAVADYWHYSVPMDLYTLCIDARAPELDVPANCLPGFEFYLV